MPIKYMTEEESIRLLNDEKVGHLATSTSSAAPYITPLHYIYHQGCIYFHCGNKGRKLDNIAENNQVCFAVNRVAKTIFAPQACSCTSRYQSVLVFGRASIVSDANRKVEILTALTAKYSDGLSFKPISVAQASSCGVVEINIDTIHGKRNVDPEDI